MKKNRQFGERGRNRTFNLLIKSQLLCQLSYAPGSWKYKSSGCRRVAINPLRADFSIVPSCAFGR